MAARRLEPEHILAVDRRSPDGKDRIELVAGKGWRVIFGNKLHTYDGRKKYAAITLWKLQKLRKARQAKEAKKRPALTRHQRLMRDDDPLDQALS